MPDLPHSAELSHTANQLYRARYQQTPPREAIVCFDGYLETVALGTTGKWNLHHQLGDGLVVF